MWMMFVVVIGDGDGVGRLFLFWWRGEKIRI
jgi:hypothetical protein